jgi:hypothetical protein
MLFPVKLTFKPTIWGKSHQIVNIPFGFVADIPIIRKQGSLNRLVQLTLLPV